MPEQGSTPLVLVAGTATGEVLRLDEPLSFWGGMETVGGRIIDQRHPQVGEIVAGRVLVMPFGRGSSSGSSVRPKAGSAATFSLPLRSSRISRAAVEMPRTDSKTRLTSA